MAYGLCCSRAEKGTIKGIYTRPASISLCHRITVLLHTYHVVIAYSLHIKRDISLRRSKERDMPSKTKLVIYDNNCGAICN